MPPGVLVAVPCFIPLFSDCTWSTISVDSEMEPRPKRPRPAHFKLEIPGDDEVKQPILSSLQTVREKMLCDLQKPVNNCDIMKDLIETWMKYNKPKSTTAETSFQSHLQVTRNQVDDEMFIVSKSALSNFSDMISSHQLHCSGKMEIKKTTYRGHVAIMNMKCSKNTNHAYLWSSSPYLPINKYLVNYRIVHAFASSGLLPVMYRRFCEAAGIGVVSKQERQRILTSYSQCVEREYEQAVECALVEEIASTEDMTEGISVISDARHGWRKNAKDTSVVVIGEHSHKVLQHEHVTKMDDPVTQRHEALGTERCLNQFLHQDVPVKMWIHDRNPTVNKNIRNADIINQNDLWHGIKSLKKDLKKISAGPKYKHSTTWHRELADKVEPVANHVHWAARNNGGDPSVMRSKLDSIVLHYQNKHSRCDPSSRCQSDKNYEPSRIVITDPKAEKMLTTALHKSTIYKSAEDFFCGKETHYIESFNNVLNVFQDKRIALSSLQYKMRAQLAVLHWNENVDRPTTSTWTKPSGPNRRGKTKKIYTNLTYNYRENLWKLFMDGVF